MVENVDFEIKKVSQEIFDNSRKWIENNIDFFDVTNNRKTASEELQFKAFIELLFMTDMFYPEKLFSSKTENEILGLEKKIMEKVSFSKYFFHDPALVSGSQETIIFNKNHNISNKAFANDKVHFENMVQAKLDILAQRTPYRLLDSAYSMYKANVNNNLFSRKFYYNLTVLSDENFNYLYLSDSSAYSVTHSLFYITDMGREHPQFLDYKYIKKILLNMIVFYSCKNNMDIMGESLLSLFFINHKVENGNVILAALKLIKANQNKAGYIYSPRHLNDSNMSKEEIFFENYHTTMVNLGVANVFR